MKDERINQEFIDFVYILASEEVGPRTYNRINKAASRLMSNMRRPDDNQKLTGPQITCLEVAIILLEELSPTVTTHTKDKIAQAIKLIEVVRKR